MTEAKLIRRKGKGKIFVVEIDLSDLTKKDIKALSQEINDVCYSDNEPICYDKWLYDISRFFVGKEREE